MKIIIYIYLFFTSFIMTLALVPLVKRVAFRFHVMDEPNERKVHKKPKPRLGGLAIYASFMAVILLNVAFMFLFGESSLVSKYFPFITTQIPLFLNVSWKLFMILAGGTVVLIVGILDDIMGTGFSYRKKFLGQFIAVTIVMLAGVKTSFMPTPFLNYLITALWIVGITNSFNLLDNMDGLSSGVAVISSLVLVVITAMQGQFFSAMIFCVYAGSTAGFLPYNFYQSKIFMGDAGSLFIGFLIGTLTITSSYVTTQSPSLLPVIVPVLSLSIPLYDTISVIIIRLKLRRPLFVGDKNHFSHRLLNLGMSERGAVLFIYLIAFCVGITAILVPGLPLWGSIVILLQALIIYIVITVLMILGAREATQDFGRRPA
jgi:UDP-GlcNAc:undecaprenyl-phosphate GlcNAc-1-phosphate transferase